MNNYLSVLLIVFVFQLSRGHDDEYHQKQQHQYREKCPSTTKPHSIECNKYLKCVELPTTQKISWVTLKCQEGLIYDKNLLSCAIPDDDWECQNGVQNENYEDNLDLDNSHDDSKEEFLEVIDESFPFKSKSSRSDDDFLDGGESSGDGDGLHSYAVTSSPSTVRMITTQLQRLTQLVKHVEDEQNGVVRNEMTPNELNTFLSVQKIQTNPPASSDYSTNSQKTPMSQNGQIHPEILSTILDQQNELNNKLTTLSMDELPTTKIPIVNPTQYIIAKSKSPQADDVGVELTSRVGPHQIIVNRPEGSVLFNVPSDHEKGPSTSPQTSFLSADILRSIVEISKHMALQNHQQQQQQQQQQYEKQQPIPHPIYYAVPIPIYYGNNSTTNFQINHPKVDDENYTNKDDDDVEHEVEEEKVVEITTKKPQNRLKNFHQPYQNYLNNPNYFYQSYQPAGYQYYQQQNQQPFNNYQSQFYHSNYPGYAYGSDQNFYSYENSRPFVMDSSAPLPTSYDQYSKPKRESYESNEEDDDDNEKNGDSSEILYDTIESTSNEDEKKNELICSIFVQRQANKTDCFRYYVCNAKTKEVSSYSCPAFTSFNDVTKYCDSETYPDCKRRIDQKTQNLNNRKIFNEANAALEQVKRESQKVEKIANLMKYKNQKIYSKRRNQYPSVSYENHREDDDNMEAEIPNFYQSYSNKKTHLKPNLSFQQRPLPPPPPSKQQFYQAPPPHATLTTSSVNRNPIKKVNPIRTKTSTTSQKVTRKKSKKQKRVKCHDIGNIPDPNSIHNYWHCFRGSDGRMKRINRKCTANFIFCSKSRFCTLQNRC